MNYFDLSEFPLIEEDSFAPVEMDFHLRNDNKQFLDIPMLLLDEAEPGKTRYSEEQPTPSKWTNVEQDILEKVRADHPKEGWEFIATFFPFHPKTEIKKRVRNLRKKTKLQKVPESNGDKIQCLKELKERLSLMEKDLLGSCMKIKELIKRRDN